MKIAIAGCTGRVGRLLVAEVMSDDNPDIELCGGSTLPGHALVGQDIGEVVFNRPCGITITDNAERLFEEADAVIDFTTPKATVAHAKIAAMTKTIFITGTTGLSEEDEAVLNEASTQTSIVYAGNMSLGVNLLAALVEQAAARLGIDWDIEITEMHHKHKVDSPSGTALLLGNAAAKGRNSDPTFVTNRNGARNEGDIGFAVLRGGDVVGEHTAGFYGAGERIELSHKATDRSIFAKGAVHAALWAKDQEDGLYSMRDVLDL